MKRTAERGARRKSNFKTNNTGESFDAKNSQGKDTGLKVKKR